MITTPTIGILAIKYKTDYIVSKAVVDWLLKHDCKVVYLSPHFTDLEFHSVFKQIDGVIFPGGNDDPLPQNKVYRMAKKIIEISILRKIPILGICLGFQYLTTFFSGKTWDQVHIKINAPSMPNKLYPTNENVALDTKVHYSFNHYNAIPTEVFYSNENLMRVFDVFTTSKHNGRAFISTIQGKNLPFFGMQWHPEKPEHEFSPVQQIPRSNTVKKSGEMIARNFINIARIGIQRRVSILPFLKKYEIRTLKVHKNQHPESMEYDDPLYYYVLP